MKFILPFLLLMALMAFRLQDNSLAGRTFNSKDMSLVFGEDSLNVFYHNEKVLTAAFVVKDSTVSFRERYVSRMSCDSSFTGEYSFIVSDQKLKFKLLNDACPGRIESLDGAEFLTAKSK